MREPGAGEESREVSFEGTLCALSLSSLCFYIQRTAVGRSTPLNTAINNSSNILPQRYQIKSNQLQISSQFSQLGLYLTPSLSIVFPNMGEECIKTSPTQDMTWQHLGRNLLSCDIRNKLMEGTQPVWSHVKPIITLTNFLQSSCLLNFWWIKPDKCVSLLNEQKFIEYLSSRGILSDKRFKKTGIHWVIVCPNSNK